ncbi:MAG: hypothetical protein FWE25_03755 [Lachnospiraceae bacterium]|nr:hypothetical protein [Lachnospiraceae bacterium]
MGKRRKKRNLQKMGRAIPKRVFGLVLTFLIIIGGIQVVASGNLMANDLELEFENQAENKVDVESVLTSISPLTESAPITTAAAFRTALLGTYGTINLGGNISVAFTTGANSVPALSRNIRINGNGYTITVTNANNIASLGTVSGPTTLILENVTITRTGAALGYAFTAGTGNANWTVVLDGDVQTGTGIVVEGTTQRQTRMTYGWDRPMTWRGGSTTNTGANAETNRGGLVDAQAGTVVVRGTGNRLGMHGDGTTDNRHHIFIRDFRMEQDSSLYTTSGGGSGAAIRIAGSGTIDIGERAILNIRNVGTRAGTPAGGTGNVAAWATEISGVRSDGINGLIGNTILRPGAQVDIEAHKSAFVSRSSHTLVMQTGAVMNLTNNHQRGFALLLSPRVDLRSNKVRADMNLTQTYSIALSGVGTELNIFAHGAAIDQGSGGMHVAGDNSSISVNDGAALRVYGARDTAMHLLGDDFNFVVGENGLMRIISHGYGLGVPGWAGGAAGGGQSTLRFLAARRATFDIDGGTVYITASRGKNRSQGLRFSGEANNVRIRNGGNLSVRNYIANGNDNTAVNQWGNAMGPMGGGIFFTSRAEQAGGTDTFVLEDRYSQVDIFSYSSIALGGHDTTGIVRVEAGPETVFTATGSRPVGQSIFRGARLHFSIDEPLYFDFRNNGGGRVFSSIHTAGNPSLFEGNNTDLAIWAMDPDTFEGEPIYAWTNFDFNVTGTNFNTVVSATDADFQTEFGAMTPDFGRLSANNATAVINWLRIPTNADGRVYGHVSVGEGRPDVVGGVNLSMRDAWPGEVYVEVEFEDVDGNVVHTGEGATDERAMFGVDPIQEGLFQVVFEQDNAPALLGEGYTAGVIGARRWSGGRTLANDGRGRPSRTEDILSNIERTRDVMPPAQVTLAPALSTIAPGTENITGTAEPFSIIRVSVNNAWVMDVPNVVRTVQADGITGAFTFSLAGVTLAHGQEVRVHASDERGMGGVNPYTQRPETPFGINHNLYDILNSPITVAPNNGLPSTAGGIAAGWIGGSTTRPLTLNGHFVNGNIQGINPIPFHDAIIPAAVMRLVEYTGTLTISGPNVIDFGTMYVGAGARFGNRLPHTDIVVTDTRLNRDAWRVEAILISRCGESEAFCECDEPIHLYNMAMSHELPNGLVRRHADGVGGFMSSILTPQSAVVFHSHTPANTPGTLLPPESTNISGPWNSTNNGLMVETFGEMVRVGSYTAVIEWTVMQGLPD